MGVSITNQQIRLVLSDPGVMSRQVRMYWSLWQPIMSPDVTQEVGYRAQDQEALEVAPFSETKMGLMGDADSAKQIHRLEDHILDSLNKGTAFGFAYTPCHGDKLSVSLGQQQHLLFQYIDLIQRSKLPSDCMENHHTYLDLPDFPCWVPDRMLRIDDRWATVFISGDDRFPYGHPAPLFRPISLGVVTMKPA